MGDGDFVATFVLSNTSIYRFLVIISGGPIDTVLCHCIIDKLISELRVDVTLFMNDVV